MNREHSSLSRRQLASGALLAPAGALLAANGLAVPRAAAAGELATLPVYFGCGCFWHVQHEFVELERSLLKRPDLELSSRCGYAGGTRLGAGGKVCYHNVRGVADYGKLGHAEAVSMRIPPSSLPEFAKLYFSLFVAYNLPGRTVYERADPQDGGGEYRSVLGIPGGINSPYFAQIEAANAGKMRLIEGKGDEPDTLFKRTVYVMNSDEFPFLPGESYHQFHNDFQSKAYGKAYNDLRTQLTDGGKLSDTGCPTGPLGL
ncbi:hypothetical protein T492DRAFT_588570 [Pavlovales sp. CCMP2436]|nr:hypothetical protein T492DRAFT_588570 [Pavlovales sp. CCMP2436]